MSRKNLFHWLFEHRFTFGCFTHLVCHVGVTCIGRLWYSTKIFMHQPAMRQVGTWK